MIQRITRSPIAVSDMLDIAEYFAEHNTPQAGERFLDTITATEKALLDMPKMGVLRSYKSTRLKDMRMIPVNDFKNYLLFYTLNPEHSIFCLLFLWR
ncbi:MAG: type II toxin-antitoxin system RelE/ParE family toxin [Robiginitomaculum sp.]|nr:type II toxin-antitoxin system RelE/ParE family toxin [Robiginitomaculum sp.]